MVQVIIRALNILEFVALQGKEPVQLMKIAENVGLSQPTTANIVKTLVHKNYLEQISRRAGYRLGASAYQLTGNPSYQGNLILAANEPMEELTRRLNETSLLGVLRNHKRIILHIVNCDQDLQVRPRPIAEPYVTASGRLLISFLSAKELDNMIKVIGLPSIHAWPEMQKREKLDEILLEIKKRGFVQTLSDNHIVGLAVPIYKNDQVVASLSVFIPESRFTTVQKEKASKLLRKTAQKVKDRLEMKFD